MVFFWRKPEIFLQNFFFPGIFSLIFSVFLDPKKDQKNLENFLSVNFSVHFFVHFSVFFCCKFFSIISFCAVFCIFCLQVFSVHSFCTFFCIFLFFSKFLCIFHPYSGQKDGKNCRILFSLNFSVFFTVCNGIIGNFFKLSIDFWKLSLIFGNYP